MTYEQAYVEGFCKAAEAIGVNPRSLARRMTVKTAMEKRSYTLVELLTTAGLLGGGLYGAKKLAIDPYLKRKALANRTTGQKFVDGVKSLASQHPYVGRAAA